MSAPAGRGRGLVVAIDGPSGAGKSTVGRALAEALSYTYLDTGAMYRAIAVAALEAGVAPDDEAGLARLAAEAAIDFEESGRRVILNRRDVTEAIRTRDAARLASVVARVKAVRRELVRRQQALGRDGGVVLDGRDIGSVVFPGAEVKFYLDAAPESRARRRFDELRAKGQEASFEAILEEIKARDHQDMTRADSPLVRCPDAVAVDTTAMPPEEVLATLVARVRARQGEGSARR